jgi:hypothetical protein
MNIKKTIALSLFASICMVTIQSCKKYEDGPMISLLSRTARVANTWKVDNYKVNDTDFTSLFAGYTETYTKDGIFSYEWGVFGGTGKWEFQNKYKEIKISGIDTQPSQILFILKLESKQFWYYYMDGNDKKEFHMVEN